MSKLIEFINPNTFSAHLVGPDRARIIVKPNQKISLPEYFMKYVPTYLRPIKAAAGGAVKGIDLTRKVKVSKPPRSKQRKVAAQKRAMRKVRQPEQTLKESKTASRANLKLRRGAGNVNALPKTPKKTKIIRKARNIVGMHGREDSGKAFKEAFDNNLYSISNNIGIGILSYNRLPSIKRLLNSIRQFTDLSKATVFISDESDNKEVKEWLRKQKDIVFLDNTKRQGIASQSNRLLRCLKRFKYCLLLNDDVEVLKTGWEHFYFKAMESLAFKCNHFCYRQIGLYGARANTETLRKSGKITIKTIVDKPHGAVMAFTNDVINKVGYFDESFGNYGMEHVDWSNRVHLSGLNPEGFHDIAGSDKFFKIHKDKSAVAKSELANAKSKYEALKKNKKRIYIECPQRSLVPSITYIMPLRNIGRQKCVETIINNIRAQKFPEIELIVVEQDIKTNFNATDSMPVSYMLSKSLRKDQQFTKAAAFNLGVSKATNHKVVLHDADIMVPDRYTKLIYTTLDSYESCHIGAKVVYLDQISTNKLNKLNKLEHNSRCHRVVTYFEGGSLACTRDTYIKVGGFNEMFEGYGIEDCDFYERMSENSKFFGKRTIACIHLMHGRTAGWEEFHDKNKRIQAKFKKLSPSEHIKSLVDSIKHKYNEFK